MNAKKKLSLANKMAKENEKKTLYELSEKYKLSMQQVHNMIKLSRTGVDEVRAAFLGGDIKFSDLPKIIKLKDDITTKERLKEFVTQNRLESDKPANTLKNFIRDVRLQVGRNKAAQRLFDAISQKNVDKTIEIVEEMLKTS